MAHKLIYICDLCESYVENKKDITEVSISVPRVGDFYEILAGNAAEKRFRENYSVTRELCQECRERIGDLLKIDRSIENLVEDLFDEFTVPSREDVLDQKIKDYEDSVMPYDEEEQRRRVEHYWEGNRD